VSLPGIVHAVVLRSPHAHARIVSIDTEAARAAPGVLLVLTGADWLVSGWGDLPVAEGRMRANGQRIYRPKYSALAHDRVRWVGDHVAFVAAETRNQAADAAELIEVEYEILPAVTGPADAAQPGAPLVWEDCENNICFTQAEGNRQAVD